MNTKNSLNFFSSYQNSTSDSSFQIDFLTSADKFCILLPRKFSTNLSKNYQLQKLQNNKKVSFRYFPATYVHCFCYIPQCATLHESDTSATVLHQIIY
jgi:hypothetical protein